MYSNPTYDPNPLASLSTSAENVADLAYFRTKDHEGFYPGRPMSTEEFFQPGSTSKVVTSEAAYNLDPSLGNLAVPAKPFLTFPNSNKVLGGVGCGGTVAQMLPPSCDTGFGQLGILLGADNLTHQGALFGYNQVPPIDLPNVIKSEYPTAAALAPGQGGQAYTAYTADRADRRLHDGAPERPDRGAGIADHGTVMTPHVMAQITTPRATS